MIKLKDIIMEMALPNDTIKNKTWYHGTKSLQSAESILRSGYIKPPEIIVKKSSQLTPVKGKTYITTNLEYAIIYALGANMIGQHIKDMRWANEGNEYGYLFVIDGKDLTDVQPDEDVIGEIPQWEGSKWEPHDEFSINLLKDKNTFLTALNYCKRYMTPIQYQKAKDGEVGYQAAGGKRVLQKMPDWLKLRLVSLGAHSSNTGPLPISQCWKFDKINDNPKLKKDGSNFFQIAQRIK
jgi:hypothetical protein